jgi:hypothetical protein
MCVTSSSKLAANLIASHGSSITTIVPEENCAFCGDKILIVKDKRESELQR